MPDRLKVVRVDGPVSAPVLGVVHPLGDLRDVVADAVQRPLRIVQHPGQRHVRDGGAVRVADQVAQRLGAVAYARRPELRVERVELRLRHAADDDRLPHAPFFADFPDDLVAAVDRAHGDAVLAGEDLWPDALVQAFGDDVTGGLVNLAGHGVGRCRERGAGRDVANVRRRYFLPTTHPSNQALPLDRTANVVVYMETMDDRRTARICRPANRQEGSRHGPSPMLQPVEAG